jgi:hypothetical protein
LESYRTSLHNLLGAALREHRFLRKWHYAIDMDESNQDSLSSYLGMNHQQLCSLLLATGLAPLHGQKFQILRNHFGWDNLCVKQTLEDYYFDAMVVNNKRHYWIGIGLEPKKKKKAVLHEARKVYTALNPGTQSTLFKTPPWLPKSNQAMLQKNSSMMLSLLGVYNEEIEKNKQTDADNEQDDIDATTDRINSADDDRDKDSIHENLRTLALVLLQQLSKDQITNPVQAIEGLLKTIRVSQNAKEKARLALVSGVENNHIDKQEFVSPHFQPCQNLVSPSQSVWCHTCCARSLRCHVSIQVMVYCHIKPIVGHPMSW